jgi:hypothetical protein
MYSFDDRPVGRDDYAYTVRGPKRADVLCPRHIRSVSLRKVTVFTRIERSEWRFVILFALGTLVVTSLPYLFGYLASPDDQVFMGIAYGTPDTTQYFSWLRGFEDSFFIDNHLTPEPNAKIFMNLQWWLLAQLVRVFHLTHLQVFHIFRALAVVAFAFVTYWFTSLYFAERRHRRTAFLIAQVGSGLGWFWVVVKYLTRSSEVAFPFDLYTVEPNSFLSQMAFPHFTAALVLIILIFGLMMIAAERQQWRYTLAASGIALILGLSHAYDLLLVYITVGLYVLSVWLRDRFSWRMFWQVFVLGMISCGPAFYSMYMTSNEFPVWHDVLAQFELAGAWTPDPFHLLFLMGLPFIITLMGFDGIVPLRERSLSQMFVRIWFLANLFVVYLPIDFQIHYLNGWQLPIAILVTEVLYRRIVPSASGRRMRRARTWAKWLPFVLILAVLPTNLYLLAWRFIDLGRYQHPYFIHRDEDAALEWLADHANTNQVVFCAQTLGQYVPGRTGARSFLGHWAMTKDLYEKQRMVQAFFDADTPDDERQAILQDFGVDYVLYGVGEQALGDYDPSKASYLKACFTSHQAIVYCVRE